MMEMIVDDRKGDQLIVAALRSIICSTKCKNMNKYFKVAYLHKK